VVRAAARLGLNARAANGRLALTRPMVARLRDELGMTARVSGLSPIEVRVLAALSRAPLGLASARVVAGQAGVSPTAATNALRALERGGLIRREAAVIAAGRARPVQLLHANRHSERWSELSPLLATVHPPRRRRARERHVPARLRHLFWNTAPSQLNTAGAGPYIAGRLLSTMDFDGLAWGADNLRPSDWEQAARGRGFDASVRALAHNLAHAGTLSGLFGATQIEFFHADEAKRQHLLEAPGVLAGLHVAGLKDLLAMKLKVVGDRGEMRDYYDLRLIEERGGLTLEDGITLFLERYDVSPQSDTLQHIVRALGYLDDIEEDDALPISKADLADWWRERQVRLLRHLARNPA
jgi:DNA-binding MarR family transcriptional regulator